MLFADWLIPGKPCWEQMHTDVSPFQLVSLYQPGRLLYSLGEDWLFLARGQVTQEWLTGAGEPAGSQTLSSVVAKVLSAAQSLGTAASQTVPGCCSVALWWHRPGEVKEAPRTCSIATNPLRAGHTRCPSWFCFGSEGPTLVQVYWLYPWDNFSYSALFATADSATALTSITTSWRQLLPSFPVQPHGWAMEMRNDVPHSCSHSSQGANSSPLPPLQEAPSTVLSLSGSNDPELVILGPSQICLQWLAFNSASNPKSYYVQFKE